MYLMRGIPNSDLPKWCSAISLYGIIKIKLAKI